MITATTINSFFSRSEKISGFTLIELSIVLVIIGLIVGAILMGQDLIHTAEMRATLSQIEKYNTAVHTFQVKYGFLPGDIPNPYATQFGFQSRGQYAGEGDGDGVILGVWQDAANSNYGIPQGAGELIVFWEDLSAAGLIEGSFTTASTHVIPGAPITGVALNAWLPQAKLGHGNYVYVWSPNQTISYSPLNILQTSNYFGISAVTSINSAACGSCMASNAGISVNQTYNMDKKVDDGFPITGRVIAAYVNQTGGVITPAAIWTGTASSSVAVSGSPTTCYDNGNNTANQIVYSNEINSGSGVNCALSFLFQ